MRHICLRVCSAVLKAVDFAVVPLMRQSMLTDCIIQLATPSRQPQHHDACFSMAVLPPVLPA